MTDFLPPAQWQSGTNQNSIPANDNSLRFEITQRNAGNATTAQPVSPTNGDTYILQATHTGSQWASFNADDVVIYKDGTWYAYTPVDGMKVSVDDDLYVFLGSGGWQLISGGGGGGGSVAGSDKQIQFNDGGSFGAEAGFEYDKTTNTQTVVNVTYSGLALTAASSTGGAGFRLPHGTAPTTPTNGDMWTTTTGLFVRVNGATVGPLSAGGGSLTNWTEAVSTAAPNATIPVTSFTATNAATNVDAAILPKGSGALMRHIPDNTTTGGNKRGSRAVDFQASRSAATMVASAIDSVISGGSNNTASSSNAVVAGGDNNTASNTGAVVAGGSTNTASGQYAAVLGGATNTASNSQATVVGGSSNTASGLYSLACGRNTTANGTYSLSGGYGSTARGIIGAVTFSSYYNGSQVGKHQRGLYTLVARTTDATATAMTADLAAAGAANQLILPNSSTYAVHGLVSARKATTGDYATWEFRAAVTRDANAASTVVTAAAPTSIGASGGAAAWVLAITADTTNGGLRLTVTGAAASTISWTAALSTAESLET